MGARMPRSRHDLRRLCGEIRVAHTQQQQGVAQLAGDYCKDTFKECCASRQSHCSVPPQSRRPPAHLLPWAS